MTDTESSTPIEAVALDRERDGVAIAIRLADGRELQGLLSPVLAAKLARECGYLAADALAELRTGREGRAAARAEVEWPNAANLAPEEPER